YWLGESHYVSQHNAEALQAFEVVVSRYPDSTKAPGALFKIGRLQQAAGNNDAARASYEKVLRDYPDSPAAGLARQRLEQSGR
ncbi:MAG: tetratricopeptide repeat protein, partial [Gammaproteobacteria bacterium]|nr:tetratricopeptide repeat protein [Gammaproteobacteria bacterium]